MTIYLETNSKSNQTSHRSLPSEQLSESTQHHRQSACDCGRGIETVKHFLLLCRKYEEPRNELQKKVGGRNMRVENLLGDPKIVKDTLEFVEKTRRFNFD